MESDDVNHYKRICERHFVGKRVFFDTQISSEVRWRPHLYVTNGEELIIDIRTTSTIPAYQLEIYREIRNQIPNISIYSVIISSSGYYFDFLEQCNRYGIGVFVLEEKKLREIIKPEQPTVERIRERGQLVIRPGAPFGNILNLKRCFRSCKKFVHWYENNLPKKVLEILHQGIGDGDIVDVEEIRLLRALDEHVDESFLSEFKRFQAEFAEREINAEMRVICDKRLRRSVHARYLYSDKVVFVMPPLNSLLANQWDKIFTSEAGIPNFQDYWKKGLDLVAQWNEIQGEKVAL